MPVAMVVVVAVMVGTAEAVAFLLDEPARGKLGALLLKARAAIRKRLGMGRKQRKQQRFSFHYDPCSYALNFDDAASLLALP